MASCGGCDNTDVGPCDSVRCKSGIHLCASIGATRDGTGCVRNRHGGANLVDLKGLMSRTNREPSWNLLPELDKQPAQERTLSGVVPNRRLSPPSR